MVITAPVEPLLKSLAVGPRRFRARRAAATVTFELAHAGRTTFTVERRTKASGAAAHACASGRDPARAAAPAMRG